MNTTKYGLTEDQARLVVEDDGPVDETVARYLRACGFHSGAFYSVPGLLSQLAFVLWYGRTYRGEPPVGWLRHLFVNIAFSLRWDAAVLGNVLRQLEGEVDLLKQQLATVTRERDEAREQLQRIGRKAFWASKNT
jgi:hypothetical protein